MKSHESIYDTVERNFNPISTKAKFNIVIDREIDDRRSANLLLIFCNLTKYIQSNQVSIFIRVRRVAFITISPCFINNIEYYIQLTRFIVAEMLISLLNTYILYTGAEEKLSCRYVGSYSPSNACRSGTRESRRVIFIAVVLPCLVDVEQKKKGLPHKLM